MTASFTTRILSRILGLLMLAAIAAPYAHAALEVTEHEQCGMESCKRAGHCCCRKSQPGKPHWDSKDICHHGCTLQPAVVTPAIAPESLAIVTIFHTTAAPLPTIPTALPSTGLRVTQFQRPPPTFS